MDGGWVYSHFVQLLLWETPWVLLSFKSTALQLIQYHILEAMASAMMCIKNEPSSVCLHTALYMHSGHLFLEGFHCSNA